MNAEYAPLQHHYKIKLVKTFKSFFNGMQATGFALHF